MAALTTRCIKPEDFSCVSQGVHTCRRFGFYLSILESSRWLAAVKSTVYRCRYDRKCRSKIAIFRVCDRTPTQVFNSLPEPTEMHAHITRISVVLHVICSGSSVSPQDRPY